MHNNHNNIIHKPDGRLKIVRVHSESIIPCISKNMVKSKQLTIIWYIDDLNMLRNEPEEVMNMLECMEKKYGNIRITMVNKHNYLGM